MVPAHLAPIAPSCPHCLSPLTICRCGTTPAGAHDDIQGMPKPRTFKLFYGTPICQVCQLAAMYCACSRTVAADTLSSEDGPAQASLSRRIQECKESK